MFILWLRFRRAAGGVDGSFFAYVNDSTQSLFGMASLPCFSRVISPRLESAVDRTDACQRTLRWLCLQLNCCHVCLVCVGKKTSIFPIYVYLMSYCIAQL